VYLLSFVLFERPISAYPTEFYTYLKTLLVGEKTLLVGEKTLLVGEKTLLVGLRNTFSGLKHTYRTHCIF
jgi:hypothetical protein